jgi:hypothetical protein
LLDVCNSRRIEAASKPSSISVSFCDDPVRSLFTSAEQERREKAQAE